MNEKVLDFVTRVGVPAALALALGWMLHEQQAQAAAERASHTVILIDQMTALRKACICSLADLPDVDGEAAVKAAKAQPAKPATAQ